MWDDCGKTGCAGGGGSFALFLLPIWVMGLILFPVLILYLVYSYTPLKNIKVPKIINLVSFIPLAGLWTYLCLQILRLLGYLGL
jgi:hypothetical protein